MTKQDDIVAAAKEFIQAKSDLEKHLGREISLEELADMAATANAQGASPPIEGNNDRAYRSELVVFEALMTFQAKLGTGPYNTQERARIADSIAKDATAKIREYWERDQ